MSQATRVKRGANQDDLKPSRRQETFKATSERAQQARQRAQQCFLSMIEGPLEPQEFIAKARYINPEVYADVVMERAVAGLCGYPLCSNIFTDTYGSQTYVIRRNMLYDITERRNFCSNVCYEASVLVQKQVLTLPLYLRDTQDADIKDVHLPCLSKLKGQHGKLVDITGGMPKIEVEDKKLKNKRMGFKSVDDIALESLVNWSENETDLNKEQIKSGDEPNESNDDNQNKKTAEGSYLNQNRTTAKENKKEEAKSASEVKKNNDTDESRTTQESNGTNESSTTAESSDVNWSRTITEVDSTSTQKDSIPITSPSEKPGHEVGLGKVCVEGQDESDTQKEENLKEDSGYDSSQEVSKEAEDVCDIIQKERMCDKDGSRSECVVPKEKLNKGDVGDSSTHGGVCSKDGRRPKSDKAEKKTQESESQEDPNSEAVVVDSLAEVLKVEAVMRQWVSFDSLRMVLGDLYVRGMLEHLSHSWDDFDTTSGLRLSVEAKTKYVAICRRLEHEERQELEGEEQDTLCMHLGKQNRPSKPLPDYSQLQHQAKKQQLKVVSFLGGSDQYEKPIEEEEKLNTIPEEEGKGTKPNVKRKCKAKKQSEESHTQDPTLPFVDSYSQVAWRQNIVIEKVAAYLQQLLGMMWLSVHEVKKLLGLLVATFHLSPNNISFRPKQWRLITLILLKMLSVRYPAIQDALRTEEGLSMQRNVLSSFSLDLGYCDRIMSYLTEIQHVLSKDFKDEKPAVPETKSTFQDARVPQEINLTVRNADTDRVEDLKATNKGNNLTQTVTEDIGSVKISDHLD